MKIEEGKDGRSTVYLDDDDYVFIVNIKNRHSAFHWPNRKQKGEDLLKLIYHLAQINLKVNDTAMDVGLTPEDIAITTVAAYDDYVAEEGETYREHTKTPKEEEIKYDRGFFTSGNNQIH